MKLKKKKLDLMRKMNIIMRMKVKVKDGLGM
jgi:hypothetical protein